MGLEVNTDREFRSLDELADLVRAVVEAPVRTQETRWIEWKRSLDLDKPAGRFTVAKAILGFANRSPEMAARTCEGTAYLVVGAEPGRADGVKAMDHAVLAQKIKTYADGPRWNAQYVTYSGVEVLVIVVTPPRNGDPIYSLQTEYDNAQAGIIFHRGEGLTERAGPNELLMLQERLIRGTQRPDLDLDLSVDAEPLTRLHVDEESERDWLDRREKYIRSTRKPPAPLPGAGAGGFLSSNLFADVQTNPEDRAEFDRRVAEHVEQCQGRLVANVFREIAASDQNKVTCAVANHTDDPVEKAQLTVLIQSRRLLAYSSVPSETPMPQLPRWPDILDRIAEHHRSIVDSFIPMPLGSVAYAAVTDRADGVELTFNIGDLRPGQQVQTHPITIIAGAPTPEQIPVTLIGSAMNRRGTKTVSTTLQV